MAARGWAKIKAAAAYAGLGERTVRGLLKRGLRFSRLPSGTILVKYEWIDQFLENLEEGNVLEKIADEVCKDLR